MVLNQLNVLEDQEKRRSQFCLSAGDFVSSSQELKDITDHLFNNSNEDNQLTQPYTSAMNSSSIEIIEISDDEERDDLKDLQNFLAEEHCYAQGKIKAYD